MASQLILTLHLFAILMNSCSYGLASKSAELHSDGKSNITLRSYNAVTSEWGPAVATWYGEPNGFGTAGGACAYGSDVGKAPFSSLVSAGGPSLFHDGKGCGTCFQVRCSSNEACSGKPVTVVIIDSCPGGPCASDATHFDLSGTSFGALATPGQEDALRNAGSIAIEFQRIACNYSEPLKFKVDDGSTPYYFAAAIEYIPGDGDIAQVDLQQTSVSDEWLPMQHSWGALWAINSVTGSPLEAPFSIRITNAASEIIVAENVIPSDWTNGAIYTDGN